VGISPWYAGLAAGAYLTLAVLAARARARHPLATHLGAMASALSVYQLTELARVWNDDRRWVWIGSSAAALSAIPTVSLFHGLLGQLRKRRGSRQLSTPYFVAVALLGLSPIVDPGLAWLYDDGVWGLALLAGLLPAFAPVLVESLRRVRRARHAERARAQLVLGAFVLGIGSVCTDLLSMAGVDVPALSSVGLVLAAVVVGALTLEARLIERPQPLAIANGMLLALVAVLAQIVVVAWAGDRVAFVALGTVLVVLAVVVGLRPLASEIAEQRARTLELLTLGRFARQFAHDVRNPLAAIKGAGQFLETELAEGRSVAEHADMLRTIVEQVERIDRALDDHARYARVEPERALVELEPWVHRALDAVRGSAPTVDVRVELDAAASKAWFDPFLVGVALENLLRNACEAMPDGGTLVVRASLDEAERGALRIAVEDSGPGIDPSLVDRMLDGHYTTKPGGSGLGLAFVRRVAEAHGGTLDVDSELGRGTRMTIRLPMQDPPASHR
jgi:signal transduction histidine kinase